MKTDPMTKVDMKAKPKRKVFHFRLADEDYEALKAQARQEGKGLAKVIREELWELRQQLDPGCDGNLLWVITQEGKLLLTVTTTPWHGVKNDPEPGED
jgi:uncharacterized cupredoxin-like copper-binding protein